MENLWAELIKIYYQNQLAWQIALGVLILLGLAYYPSSTGEEGWWDSLPRRRGRMLRRARRNYVEQQMVDDFVNSIEERVYNGIYTREEAKEAYRKLKQLFPVRDLFPTPELLKEAIQRRKAAGIHEPVPLPDVMPELKKPKHMFDKKKPVTA